MYYICMYYIVSIQLNISHKYSILRYLTINKFCFKYCNSIYITKNNINI